MIDRDTVKRVHQTGHANGESSMSAPLPPAALAAEERFVTVPLRPHFFEASAFFPMPIVLLATRGGDGAVNLAPYSRCFPHLGNEGHRLELIARGSSKTAANLLSSRRVSVNFIPDKPEYLANCKILSAPVPTAEKMPNSIFTCVASRLAAADDKVTPPLVAEAVQVFECRLLQSEPWGEGELRFLLEIEGISMQPYWARVLESGRSGPRLPVDYGFRRGSSTWMSRPSVVVSGPRLRPEFIAEVSRSPESVIEDFAAALRRPGSPVVGKVIGNVLQLNIPSAEVTTWSPSMELAVEPGPGGSTIHARIGPQPTVWTTFMFLHLLIAMIGLGGLMWGLSKWFLGGELWALWIPVAAVLLHAFVAGAAFIGQGLGADQIYRLRTFMSDVLGP
jgi:flavin reductase (DIM6/NTAB) family NADH-FMN oxidoreductase RutF